MPKRLDTFIDKFTSSSPTNDREAYFYSFEESFIKPMTFYLSDFYIVINYCCMYANSLIEVGKLIYLVGSYSETAILKKIM